RTLRGEGKISKENERIVLEAAQRLNYPVSKILRNQKRKENIFIAVVTQFHTGEFYSSFFNGFLEAATKNNVNVSLFSVSDKLTETDSFINKLRNKGYSAAVIFVPGLQSDDYAKILENAPVDFPLISCSNNIHPVIDTVTFDAYRGASLVAAHFKERGYKTVGMIEGPGDKQPEARFRKNGFVDYATHNSDIEFIWSFPGDYRLDSGIRAFKEFDKLKKKPRAIFAANDATAFGFMETARAAGYEFPKDIALCGYDNLPMCEFHYPSLTSVNTDFTQLADIAIEKLLERFNTHVPHQGVVSLVPVKLAIRNSS
ncbi:MAG TPA: LacI family DNA-binding transcriptional regulator, partial [Balneolales bacterium]|nr:LacI family DNA-binding transcriptional regulator [Balneolales bacterium]